MFVKLYNQSYFKIWNDFVSESKNGTFLFNRNFQEYHSDRFEDFSLLVFNSSNKLISLLPLNIEKNKVYSHRGLTYGGFIINSNLGTSEMLQVFDCVLSFLRNKKIESILYKAVPHIYHVQPSEEDLYGLFKNEFKLVRRDVSSTINLGSTNIKGQKQNGYRRAIKEGLKFEETSDCTSILEVANENLKKKYGTKAVHSIKEMNLLKKHFKANIKFFNICFNGEIEGGVILFITKKVVHTQYIATTTIAKRKRALDFIIVSIYKQFQHDFEWLDLGISTEREGRYLNEDLINSKEEFGFSATCYDTYELVLL